MLRYGALTLFAALCLSESASAQSARITGTVTSTDGGAPVAGVEIEVVRSGVRKAAAARDGGREAVAGGAGSYTVRARRIGFAADSATNVAVAANGAVTVNFALKPTAAQIAGVTVVGYGTQDVRDNTGSVRAVTAKEFNPGRVVSAEQLIQAKVPASVKVRTLSS
jgi:iron complex outermembrane receptor protein